MNFKYLVSSGLVATALLVLPVTALAQDASGPDAAGRRVQKAGNKTQKIRPKAAIGGGKFVSVSGSTITATGNNGKTYTILTDATTQIVRRFGGIATLSEFQVGDILNVVGRYTDDARTTIQATTVRDLSIQKRKGAFAGTVTSLTSGGFVMQPNKRTTQTVTLGSAKLVDKNGQAIAAADIQVGHKVQVKGVWDSANSTITEVSDVKDLSLPVSTTAPKTTP